MFVWGGIDGIAKTHKATEGRGAREHSTQSQRYFAKRLTHATSHIRVYGSIPMCLYTHSAQGVGSWPFRLETKIKNSWRTYANVIFGLWNHSGISNGMNCFVVVVDDSITVVDSVGFDSLLVINSWSDIFGGCFWYAITAR